MYLIHIHTDTLRKDGHFIPSSLLTFFPRFFGSEKKALEICITGSRVGFWIPQSCSNSVKDVLHSGPRSSWEMGIFSTTFVGKEIMTPALGDSKKTRVRTFS